MEDLGLHTTVAQIYEAALAPGGTTILSKSLRESVSASSCSLLLKRGDGSVHRVIGKTDNIDEHASASYETHFYDRNPWWLLSGCRRPPSPVRGSDLISTAAFLHTEFYTDWCRPFSICHMLGSVNVVRDGLLLAAATYRSRTEPDFSTYELGRFSIIAGHVARALQLADRLGYQEQAGAFSLAVLDALTIGVILIDARFRLLLANSAAERVLSSGRWFSTTGGRLRARHTSETAALDLLMQDAVESREGRGRAGGGIYRLSDRDGGVLPILAAPVSLPLAGDGLAPAAAAIVFSDPAIPTRGDAEALSAAFGLTPREGALLEALVNGRSLAEYAEQASVSINTVRSQLASIFGKTGHTRQTTLVAMAASQPVARIAGARNGADA